MELARKEQEKQEDAGTPRLLIAVLTSAFLAVLRSNRTRRGDADFDFVCFYFSNFWGTKR